MSGGPSIKHLDDVPAEEMLRFEFADRHTASIWEKWMFFHRRNLRARMLNGPDRSAMARHKPIQRFPRPDAIIG